MQIQGTRRPQQARQHLGAAESTSQAQEQVASPSYKDTFVPSGKTAAVLSSVAFFAGTTLMGVLGGENGVIAGGATGLATGGTLAARIENPKQAYERAFLVGVSGVGGTIGAFAGHMATQAAGPIGGIVATVAMSGYGALMADRFY